MKKAAIILSAFLVGCSTTKPITVDIPIATNTISIDVPKKPHLSVNDLKPNSPPNVVLKAWVDTANALNNWGEDCHDIAVAYASNQD